MSQHPSQRQDRRFPVQSLPEFRRRLIRETEEFLNERLYGRNGDWPTDEQSKTRLNPRGNRRERRQMQPRTDEGIDIRTRPNWGTLVEVRPHHRGVVDNRQLQALELRLIELAGDRAAGNIVVGLRYVESMTAGLMSLLAAIRPRLACQQRRLTVCDLRPECAQLLRGTHLEQLLCGDKTHLTRNGQTHD